MNGMSFLSVSSSSIIFLDELITRFAFKSSGTEAISGVASKYFLRSCLRRRIVLSQREFERRAYFSESEHLSRLSFLHEKYLSDLNSAREIINSVQNNGYSKRYWQDNFPLHNPNENKRSVSGGTSWMDMPKPGSFNRNGDAIIPIRVIPALGKKHEHYSLLEKFFSAFIEDNYSVYDSTSIVSEFGAWKDKCLPDAENAQKVFEIFKGQPVLLLLPDIDDDVLTLYIKCWGLGEKISEPFSAEFGSFDLSALRCIELAKLIKAYNAGLKKKGLPPDSEELKKSIETISAIEKKELDGKIIGKTLASKLGSLPVPNEKIRKSLERRMKAIISLNKWYIFHFFNILFFSMNLWDNNCTFLALNFSLNKRLYN